MIRFPSYGNFKLNPKDLKGSLIDPLKEPLYIPIMVT